MLVSAGRRGFATRGAARPAQAVQHAQHRQQAAVPGHGSSGYGTPSQKSPPLLLAPACPMRAVLAPPPCPPAALALDSETRHHPQEIDLNLKAFRSCKTLKERTF